MHAQENTESEKYDNNKPSLSEEKETDSQGSTAENKNEEKNNMNQVLCVELIIEILKHVDNRTLLNCFLVCKQWNELRSYICRKKAEHFTGKLLPYDRFVPWTSYFYMCGNFPWGKNLLYDKVCPYRNKKNVKMIEFEKGEDIPVNIYPYPKDDDFHGKCLITKKKHSHNNRYVIDLLKEGFTEHVLDKLQPIVTVCEWYATEELEGEQTYSCTYKLTKSDESDHPDGNDMRVYYYYKRLIKSGEWIKFTHSFKNYGEGLRKIKYYHGGCNGVVMAGASVKLNMNMYHNISMRKLKSFVN